MTTRTGVTPVQSTDPGLVQDSTQPVRGWEVDMGERPPAGRDGYRPPMRLAVLLPLSGEMAAAAAPVRDGFMTGYHGENRRRPEVTFFDTHGTVGGALSAYDQAVAAGHDFVVGPLSREGVDGLFRRGTLAVPVLALNRGDVAPPPGNVSFSLSPEDAGIAAADRLLQQGATRVLAVIGNSDSQRRSAEALRARLADAGVEVAAVVTTAVTDFVPFAQQGAIDGVFLALRGDAAREVVPRLSMAGLGGAPKVATSQLSSGTGDAGVDAVLDGIAFPSEPWTSRGYAPGMPSAASAAALVPTARGGAARLFGFGHDAWLLAAYLERLGGQPGAHVSGATGLLALGDDGNVERAPAWSTFRGGHVAPLADASRN
ncbi:penicillin-binding protein activator [Lysobacter sp. GX 14042]|uniref:penicillin-binding protein activator n=1 Tax=Lysobacter sp. GX 14042 TaxID=2907155 RepID=UPI001F45FCC2|nr:penicillin-binding protein activator [Lysobacter sp. GX 14042]MCE7032729.1 penicillin-binding protein activator [Lysobacter sp. GX 14042]